MCRPLLVQRVTSALGVIWMKRGGPFNGGVDLVGLTVVMVPWLLLFTLMLSGSCYFMVCSIGLGGVVSYFLLGY